MLTLEMSGFFRRMELRCRSTRTRYYHQNCCIIISSHGRVLKTIRLDMTELQSILESLPEQGSVNRFDESLDDDQKHHDDSPDADDRN